MNVPVIQAENLARDFGRFRALDGLLLNVPAGHVVAVLGPNGAGKTTLFRLLCGLIEPTEGDATLLGCNVRAMPAAVSARVACVGEGHDPPHWATLRLLLGLQSEASARFDRSAAEGLLAEHELSLRRRFGTLSKGQKRWVLATLALASGADVLIMDEPADGLDTAARRSLYDHLRQYVNDRQATALIATHLIGDIERVADDMAVIRRGQLVLHAPLEDLREQVREIEWPAGQAAPDFGPGLKLLGRRTEHDVHILWVRCKEALESALPSQIDPRAHVRPVNLETLYLVLTDSKSLVASQEEVSSCV
jgi:ABC-2 type transport system ATP-binding protein